ncbi:response regulator [Flavivirga amylovorans]|uniref:histidine kinase n=1 Tax=Flavivirga amylovorans TaxID=870486 RepID=A0ABT8X530_9FLAO|nr:response regulator [Flavivirga amylovorans]MDO5989088.1 response regulator [Flavivirga amylovorans]
MKKLKSWYSFFTDIGLTNCTNKNEQKKIRLLNIFVIIWFHISSLFIALDFWIAPEGKNVDILIHCICITILSSILFLNKKGYSAVGKIIFILLAYSTFYTLSFVVTFSQYTVCYFLLLPLIVMSLYKSNIPSYIMLAICMVTFNLNDLINGIQNATSAVDIQMLKSMDIMFNGKIQKMSVYRLLLMLKDPVVTSLFFASFYLFHYFKRLNEKNEMLLEIEKDKVLNDKIILEKQQEELKELNEFKSHFFVNLSHEIRTPLTLIKAYASKINFNLPKKDNTEKLHIVNDQLLQIQAIVDNIMDLSKLDANKLIINTKPVSLHTFLKKHYSNFKGAFEKKDIHFTLELKCPDLFIDIDYKLMSRGINNLLNNALKFTSTNGSVQLFANNDINGVTIRVQDNGIGIPEIHLNKVFDRFYQHKNHITKSQGTGVGLAFTKSIIEEHGFNIDVTSTPNIATVFSITIPNEATSELSNNIPNKNYKSITPPIINNKKPVILIVDDHPQMRKYIKSLLPDYELLEAEHGKEAIKIIEEHQIDLILTDYMMPIMDGLELVNQLKKRASKTPVIVITARSDDQGKLNMLRLGIDGYLTKPFLEEELLFSVKKSLNSYEIIKETELSQTYEEEVFQKKSNVFIKQLTDIVNENLHDKTFGVDYLADLLNTSKSSLNRKTKLVFGQSPNQIIMEARLQKAKQLLEDDPFILKNQLTQAVGMSNTTYFYKKFEERFGVTNN